jgi:two-component system alkaline phosphatase synthesis response regulator PhoP
MLAPTPPCRPVGGVTVTSWLNGTLGASMNVLMPKNTSTADSLTATGPILVVDDDRKIVTLVSTYLEREGFDVITAFDGREALQKARSEQPALIVLDLMLPELDGFETMRLIRDDSDVPVLMLTARSSLPERILGLEKGADDYLPKPFSPAELVVRVKAILRRATPATVATSATDAVATPASTLDQNDIVIDTERYEVRRDGRLIPLTPVEFKLLVTLVSADGRALTRDQLLDSVYGSDDGDVLDRTIDVHIGRLREKLDDDADQPRYVMTVRGVGYRAAPSTT